MTINQQVRTVVLILSCLLIPISMLVSAQSPSDDGNHFASLQKQLIADGFDKTTVEKVYSNSNVYFDGKGVSRFFRHREYKLNYDQFASKKSIRKARKYMKKYDTELAHAEKTYGVDQEIVTAIILVETRLGANTGRSSIINTLSTMAALSDPAVKEMFWEQVSKTSDVSREGYDKWVKRKSKWAFGELKAFLKYSEGHEIDPTQVKGSYAGALGISQFMPSNVLMYAKDGDKDGRIDLFTHADAIASVANYLKRHGWYPDIEREKAKKVVWTYNHSKYYVNIIFKISDKLKG